MRSHETSSQRNLTSSYSTTTWISWAMNGTSSQITTACHMPLLFENKGVVPGSPLTSSVREREIVHFLLAMFALNVKDGVVIVDEPELHLHPRWQRIFLGLFRDIAPTRNNQFLIATHSPVFVTPDTINSITRVYKVGGGGSTHIALRDVTLPEKKSLVRMINSQNNERVFFADKAVLVEGISDRLVLASILDAASVRFSNNEAIEILEVGGKGGFAEYRALLDALKTPSFIVADQDYLREIGSQDIRALFRSEDLNAWEGLKDKKGLDGKNAIGLLRTAVAGADLTDLAAFLQYLAGRHQRIKAPLDIEEERLVKADLERLRGEGILILEHGEIEDYLPPGGTDVKAIVSLTTDRGWVNSIPLADRRVALGRIVCEILNVGDSDREKFLEGVGGRDCCLSRTGRLKQAA